MDLSERVATERVHGDSKSALLEVVTAQEVLIQAQSEAILNLLNENMEQETLINELMKSHID